MTLKILNKSLKPYQLISRMSILSLKHLILIVTTFSMKFTYICRCEQELKARLDLATAYLSDLTSMILPLGFCHTDTLPVP